MTLWTLISSGCRDLLDDAWRDACSLLGLHPILGLGLTGQRTAWALLELSEQTLSCLAKLGGN